MRILLTGSAGSLGAQIRMELEKKGHVVHPLNRSDLDFNDNSSIDLKNNSFDGAIICHGEYFDKLTDPQIALDNFKNTRAFILNLLQINHIKFISFILSDCNFKVKDNYEWYSYNKILLENLSKYLIAKKIITHNYHPTRMKTGFHIKHSTENENPGLSLIYLSKLVALDVDLMHSTIWRAV